MIKSKAILIITDGIGCKPDSTCNAFKDATKPTYDRLFESTPKTLISTHGLSVGLPKGQMGNSEVGHMTLGAGRVLYQDLVKVSLAFEDRTIENSKPLNNILEKSNRVHLIGLLSDGGVHSHITHTVGLAKLAKSRGKKVFLHLITDGRDVSPKSSSKYIKTIEDICDDDISIASIGGRYFAMDRDNRWDRVEKGYGAIARADKTTNLTPTQYIEESYGKDIWDEFIEPIAFDDYDGMKEDDIVILTNFRSDRAREIVLALGDRSFSGFKRDYIPLNIATMTKYDANFSYPILFPKKAPSHTLSEVISRENLKQMHVAETEKYAHITFFFNGGVETPFEGESRVLIPSPDVKTYDMQPEMSAPEVTQAVTTAMDAHYEFIVVNFANGDMVGHTGNYEAACEAVSVVDTQVGIILEKAKANEYAVILTSDHGNCEEMKDKEGNMLTNHTAGDVWCFVIADGVKKLKDGCSLSSVAPTILTLMGIDIPKEMDDGIF